jgi:hypothetical protein
MKSKKAFILSLVLIGSFVLNGCGALGDMYNNVTGLVGLTDTCTVIASRAQVRSSFAVVAADLLEVKRGETLDVLEETEFEKVKWYRVRARDEDQTEGWIEAQNVITNTLLEKSKKLGEEFKNSQPQASGQLRAASNLRLSPDMNNENLLFKLDNGSTFEIIDWLFVPKAQDVSEIDDATKGEQKQPKGKTKNAEIEAAKEANEPETLTEKYDVWYQVRLDPSVSPAPVGWLFGRQVELQVPSDIVFYQHNNKKFVTWQRLDDVTDKVGDKSDKMSKPASWVILWRTNMVKAIDGVEPDFDGILVLGFDKYDQLHYTVYRTNNDVSVWGLLPLKVEGTGDNKAFTVKLRNITTGQIEDKRFVVTSDKVRMRVTPPPDIANYEKKDK